MYRVERTTNSGSSFEVRAAELREKTKGRHSYPFRRTSERRTREKVSASVINA